MKYIYTWNKHDKVELEYHYLNTLVERSHPWRHHEDPLNTVGILANSHYL